MSSRAVSSRAPSTTKEAARRAWLVANLPDGLDRPFLLALFSTEVGDSDTWWHLATGKYIWQNHRLPVPGPFSYTTDLVAVIRAPTRIFVLVSEFSSGDFETNGFEERIQAIRDLLIETVEGTALFFC